jgi:hypothetical protein
MEMKKRIRTLLRCVVVSVVVVAAVGCAPGGVYVGVVVPGPWVGYPPGVLPPPYVGRPYPGYRYDDQLEEHESAAGEASALHSFSNETLARSPDSTPRGLDSLPRPIPPHRSRPQPQ